MFPLALVEDDDTKFPMYNSGSGSPQPSYESGSNYECFDSSPIPVVLEGPHHTVGQSDT